MLPFPSFLSADWHDTARLLSAFICPRAAGTDHPLFFRGNFSAELDFLGFASIFFVAFHFVSFWPFVSLLLFYFLFSVLILAPTNPSTQTRPSPPPSTPPPLRPRATQTRRTRTGTPCCASCAYGRRTWACCRRSARRRRGIQMAGFIPVRAMHSPSPSPLVLSISFTLHRPISFYIVLG